MLVGQPETDLKGELSRVVETQVDVIVKDARAAAERQDAVLVGKRVKAVVVPFDDLERRVECHPVEQIGQLAEPSADTANDLSARELHALAIAFFGTGLAQLTPKRKRLARFDQDAIDRRASDLEIFDLVLLQIRIGVSEASPQ